MTSATNGLTVAVADVKRESATGNRLRTEMAGAQREKRAAEIMRPDCRR